MNGINSNLHQSPFAWQTSTTICFIVPGGRTCHVRPRADTLMEMKQYLIVFLAALVVLGVNIGLGTNPDVPMLLRWIVALGVGLLVTFVLSKWSQRYQKRSNRDASEPR